MQHAKNMYFGLKPTENAPTQKKVRWNDETNLVDQQTEYQKPLSNALEDIANRQSHRVAPLMMLCSPLVGAAP